MTSDGVPDCVADFQVPQPAEWEHMPDLIDAPFFFAR
jgi:hypothetical protein